MKTIACRFTVLGVLMLSLAVWFARAQASPGVTFKATGSFTAGETKFPAGTYTIRQDPDTPQEWQITNDSNSYSAFLATDPGEAATPTQKSEVVFQKYEGTLVLKSFSIAGQPTAVVVQTSFAEKKAAKSGKATKVSVPAEKK